MPGGSVKASGLGDGLPCPSAAHWACLTQVSCSPAAPGCVLWIPQPRAAGLHVSSPSFISFRSYRRNLPNSCRLPVVRYHVFRLSYKSPTSLSNEILSAPRQLHVGAGDTCGTGIPRLPSAAFGRNQNRHSRKKRKNAKETGGPAALGWGQEITPRERGCYARSLPSFVFFRSFRLPFPSFFLVGKTRCCTFAARGRLCP